ncbi:Ribosomal-protein-alanine acetyltransferase [Mycena indigotica]|uniref:Ribosomal-protein-alanine acetyltransferase n=1 Tax=Mycena indigotica TaxID=2126181 RepID=A0A8H6SW39_9AGAR|nr:Ribosomal-protein-alanine acetyltransferase [Mycena indigotica]KAF7306454.1 Ribosomal-protein-alanine acetyltransferase [Mycena indigotica]
MASAAEAAQEALLKQLFVLLEDARTTAAISLAGLTIIVFDHISTFADEVELIWKTRLSLINIFYVWIRYFTLVTLTANVVFLLTPQTQQSLVVSTVHIIGTTVADLSGLKSCQRMLFGEMATSTVTIISTDLVLVARVWILYSKPKGLLIALLTLVSLEAISMSIVGYFTIRPLREFVHAGSHLTGCYSLGMVIQVSVGPKSRSPEVPRLFTYYSLPVLIIAVIMFLMTLYKCGTNYLAMGSLQRMPLFSMFLRDGVLWFLFLLADCVSEFVIWSRARPTLAQTPVIFPTAIISVIGTRVIMNIKHALNDTDFGSSSYGTSLTLPTGLETSTGTGSGSYSDRRPSKRSADNSPWYLRTT